MLTFEETILVKNPRESKRFLPEDWKKNCVTKIGKDELIKYCDD